MKLKNWRNDLWDIMWSSSSRFGLNQIAKTVPPFLQTFYLISFPCSFMSSHLTKEVRSDDERLASLRTFVVKRYYICVRCYICGQLLRLWLLHLICLRCDCFNMWWPPHFVIEHYPHLWHSTSFRVSESSEYVFPLINREIFKKTGEIYLLVESENWNQSPKKNTVSWKTFVAV